MRASLHGLRGPGGVPMRHDPGPERTLTLSSASSGETSEDGNASQETPRKRHKRCEATERMRLAKPSQDPERLDGLAARQRP